MTYNKKHCNELKGLRQLTLPFDPRNTVSSQVHFGHSKFTHFQVAIQKKKGNSQVTDTHRDF